MRLRLALGLLALALVVPAGAAATIVLQKGIGGATLDMTEAQVRAKLGHPFRTVRGTNDFGPYTTLTYKRPPLRVSFQGNAGATSIDTSSPAQRTARGIGVGSTVAEVKARVPGVKCKTEFGYRHCYVGRWTPGMRVTDFAIKAGKVSRVSIGIVID
ncbi:MAG: hypothetical protein ABR521_10725 [Gaiellaceae bacterium]